MCHQTLWNPSKKIWNIYLDLFVYSSQIFSQRKNAEICLTSFGHTIIQNARPNVILAPLQLKLDVQMHHQFGSRPLVDSLYSHRPHLSYDEMLKYERCAAASRGTNIPDLIL